MNTHDMGRLIAAESIKDSMDDFERLSELFKKTLLSISDAVIITDEQARVIMLNKSAQALTGWLMDDAYGKPLQDVFYIVDEYTRKPIGPFAAADMTTDAHFKWPGYALLMLKSGKEMPIEVSVALTKDLTDKTTGFVVAFRDMTNQKHYVEKLEGSQKHYFELAENAPIGIIHSDLLGNIIYTNKNAADTLGSPSVEETKKINLLTNKMLIKYGFSRKLEQCLRSNKSAVYELNYTSVWGKKIWLRIHIKSWIDVDKITGAQIIIDDISEKKLMEEELCKLSVTDYLTNAYNRRYIIQRLEKEIERFRRYGRAFSLIMLDVDHFKMINDAYGHGAGDLVLKSVAELIQKRIRKLDCLARWGGEEFLLLTPGIGVEKAAALAEELRMQISQLSFSSFEPMTASFGIAECDKKDTVDSIIQKADMLMYRAKEKGRNRVETDFEQSH